MQLTTIVALLAASASAAPGALSPRQSSGSVRARFYDENSCGQNGTLPPRAEVVLQASDVAGKPGCQDLTVGSFPTVFFDQSTLSRRVRVLDVSCSQVADNLDQTQGHWIDIGPGSNNLGCFTLTARSYVTLP